MCFPQQLKGFVLKQKWVLKDNRTGTIYWSEYRVSPEFRVFLNKIQPFRQKYLNSLCCVIQVSKSSLGNFSWGESILQLLFVFFQHHFYKNLRNKMWLKMLKETVFQDKFSTFKSVSVCGVHDSTFMSPK